MNFNSEMDRLVASTMAGLLKMDVSEVDIDVQLSQLGIDSVVAAEFINQISTKFKIKIPPTVLFESPSLGQFCKYLLATHTDAVQRVLQSAVPGESKKIADAKPTLVGEKRDLQPAHSEKKRLGIDDLWGQSSEPAPPQVSIPASSQTAPAARGSYSGVMDRVLIPDSRGNNIECFLSGRGAPILMFSGLLTDQVSWEKQVGPLSKRHFTIIVNAPGIGGSAIDHERFSMETILENAKRVIDVLRVGAPISVLGNSFGAIVALLFRNKFPEFVSSLVLSNTIAEFDSSSVGFSGLMKEVESNRDYLDTIISRINLSLLPHYKRLMPGFDLKREWDRVDVPTLVIAGEHDQYVSPDNAKIIHGLVRNSEIQIIPDAGHICNWTHASTYNARIEDFFDSLSKGDDYKLKRIA